MEEKGNGCYCADLYRCAGRNSGCTAKNAERVSEYRLCMGLPFWVPGWGKRTVALLRTARYIGCVWNVMAHAQKTDFVFRRNGRVHLNRRGRQLSRLLAAEVCASAVILLDTRCSEVVWRVLDNHSIRQFPLHFPTRASPCAITFQMDSVVFYFFPLSEKPLLWIVMLWWNTVCCPVHFELL
jgi:hypothetical protein